MAARAAFPGRVALVQLSLGAAQNPAGFHFSAHFVINQGKNIWLPVVDYFFLYLSCQNHYKIGGKPSETEATLNLPHLMD